MFGIGAAGNKAAVDLVNMGVVNTQCVTLINTNDEDILVEHDIQKIKLEIQFQDSAENYNVGKAAMLNYLVEESKATNLYNPIPNDIDFVTIVTSSTDVTGSGASLMLAGYISDVLEIPVHLFAFQNGQINNEFMKNLIFLDSVTIHIIQNNRFIGELINIKV